MRQTCILKLLLQQQQQHTQFSFSCNFNHQSHTNTNTHIYIVSLCSLFSVSFDSLSLTLRVCVPFHMYEMIKVFLFLLHKMQALFWYSFNRSPFSSATTAADAAAAFVVNTHTSHCVLNICKYLRCHDPKGDMIQMIYPENRKKNYLNGWVAQHEALVHICGAHRTNEPTTERTKKISIKFP